MKKLHTIALCLGLFAGGLVLGQAFSGDVGTITETEVDDVTELADSLYSQYVTGSLRAKSAAQISQLADETRVRLDVLAIKQNAEIIKLLKEIKAKK